MALYDFVEPEFRSFVLPNATLETLGTGFRWLEGPVWFGDHDCLLLSDIPNDRVMRWSAQDGISVFRSPCGFENGHARDREGRLISCSHHDRCVRRTEWDGRVTVLASHYRGRRLNAPNDVVVKSDGSIWFTDPLYGISTDYEGGKQTAELAPAVYRLDPQCGRLDIAACDFDGPNGLCFSPDERLLYIVETGHQFSVSPTRHIRRATLSDDGTKLLDEHIFHTITPRGADGIRCDEEGNVWASAGDGVHCLSPEGRLLGKIYTDLPIANLAFGGRHRSRLFLCAGHTLLSLYVNRRGAPML